MPSLEEKIKALMEAKSESALSEDALAESIEELEEKETIKTKGGTTIVDDDDDSSDDESDDKSEPDGDEDGEDTDNDGDGEDSEGDEDEDTDVAKDKKNGFKVNEESSAPGQSVSLKQAGGDEAGSGKTAKVKAGESKRDAAPGKLKDGASANKQDDNGDNSKIKAGLSKRDSGGKVANGGPSAGGADNPDVARNDAGTDLQKGAAKNPVGVKEHMVALFDGETLSEDFQKKAETIFEAAVESVAAARIEALTEEYAQKVVALQEEMEQNLDEAVEEVKDELVENIDGYLSAVVEQWLSDNQVALERGMKLEMVDSFIDGLKSLFAEHYVEVPEEKLDVIEEQAAQIEELTTQLNSAIEAATSLSEQVEALTRSQVMESVGYDLTETQKEKFATLCENIEFTEEFEAKIKTVKESYFKTGRHNESLTEEVVAPAEEGEVMSKYVSAIGKNIKF